jgi:hypothetical protein
MSWVTPGAPRPHLGHGFGPRPSACRALAVAGSAGSRDRPHGDELRIGPLPCVGIRPRAVGIAVKELMRGLQILIWCLGRPWLSNALGASRRLGSELQRDVGRERGECGRVDRAAHGARLGGPRGPTSYPSPPWSGSSYSSCRSSLSCSASRSSRLARWFVVDRDSPSSASSRAWATAHGGGGGTLG